MGDAGVPEADLCAEEDNIDEGSPYFYLTELAAKCTSKSSCSGLYFREKDEELKEGNCFPVMGCRSALSPWKDETEIISFTDALIREL